jgi:hypothetical protein
MSDDSKSNTEPPLSLTSTPTPSIIDGDDLLARHEEESLAHLCPNAKSALQKRRRCTEELAVCEMLLRQWQVKHGMEANNEDSDDPTTAMLTEEEWADRRRTVLCYAAALEGLGRRRDAMDALRLCLGVGPEWLTEHQEIDQYPPTDRLDVPVALALAKLYFKDNRKQRAKTWCDAILCRLRECQVSSFRQETKEDSTVALRKMHRTRTTWQDGFAFTTTTTRAHINCGQRDMRRYPSASCLRDSTANGPVGTLMTQTKFAIPICWGMERTGMACFDLTIWRPFMSRRKMYHKRRHWHCLTQRRKRTPSCFVRVATS